MSNIKCPLCSSFIDPDSFQRIALSSESFYDCKRCGKYSINDLIFNNFDLDNNLDLKTKLSYWVRKNQIDNSYPKLITKLVGSINKEVNLPDIEEQVKNLIIYLGNESSYSKSITINLNDIVAIIGSQDKESLLYVFDELNRLGLIKVIKPKVDNDSLMNKDVRILICQLSVTGWNKHKEITRKDSAEKDYKFKQYKLSKDERMWLSELYKYNYKPVEIRILKVQLFGKISTKFNPEYIDKRFIRENRLTLLGIWYIDPTNKIISDTHLVIEKLKGLIKENSAMVSIDSGFIATTLNINESDVKMIFSFLNDFQFIHGSANNYKIVYFGSEPYAFDKFLTYTRIEDTLENFYIENEPRTISMPTELIQSSKDSMTNQYSEQNIWKDIAKEYRMTRRLFGKKINFVNDSYKRKVIFRDVAQAYILCKNGFSKPAIILAGGVIEELLRLYIENKNTKPSKNTFDEYIKICQDKKLLKIGISRLTDSARHFRNFVHLEKEVDSKAAPSQSMASGTVAAIFTIVNDF